MALGLRKKIDARPACYGWPWLFHLSYIPYPGLSGRTRGGAFLWHPFGSGNSIPPNLNSGVGFFFELAEKIHGVSEVLAMFRVSRCWLQMTCFMFTPEKLGKIFNLRSRFLSNWVGSTTTQFQPWNFPAFTGQEYSATARRLTENLPDWARRCSLCSLGWWNLLYLKWAMKKGPLVV